MRSIFLVVALLASLPPGRAVAARPYSGLASNFMDEIEKKMIVAAAQKGNLQVIKDTLAKDPDLETESDWSTVKTEAVAAARQNGHEDVVAFFEPQSAPAPAAAQAQPAAPAAPVLHSDVDDPKSAGKERPDDFALVIGIQEYQSLPKADYGMRDSQAVRKELEALGVPARNIISLEGSAATGNKMKSYLEEWLPRNVKADSTLWVYYSGHGAPDPKTGEAFLVPWDGDPEFLKSTAYPLRQLYSDLAKTKATRVIVALDACFSGAGGRSVLAKGARPLVTKVGLGAAESRRVTVLAAASGDQITGTLDEQGHGMFTYFLLKGLQGGKSSAKTLYEYVSSRVQDEARRQNREQTPQLLGEDASL